MDAGPLAGLAHDAVGASVQAMPTSSRQRWTIVVRDLHNMTPKGVALFVLCGRVVAERRIRRSTTAARGLRTPRPTSFTLGRALLVASPPWPTEPPPTASSARSSASSASSQSFRCSRCPCPCPSCSGLRRAGASARSTDLPSHTYGESRPRSTAAPPPLDPSPRFTQACALGKPSDRTNRNTARTH